VRFPEVNKLSQGLRKYANWHSNEAKTLYVGAFVGGEVGGSAVQFTIGSEYACLSESQILDLISVLSRRLNCQSKWNATGMDSEEALILPDGTKGGDGAHSSHD